MKQAVSYVRVSSKEQQEQGYSPEAQKRLLWTFARENGFDVVVDFEDAETAKQAGRTAFNEMLSYVKENNIKHILVEKTDRLHRNFSDFVKIETLINELDLTVHFVKEGTSVGKDAPSNQKFMYGIRTLMAKNFIDNLREESAKGVHEKVELGVYPSRAPLGYLNAQDPITKKNIIVVDEKNRDLIQTLFNLYATGNHSLESIIDTVKEMGLALSLPHKRTLNKTTVSRILGSIFYIGGFVWKGKISRKASHAPIIELELWQRVQDVKNGKECNKSKKHNIIPFLYKGFLICGECPRSITAYNAKGKYPFYRCTKYKTNCSQEQIKEEEITKQLQSKLESLRLSGNGRNYLVAALKKSLEEKRGMQDRAYDSMVVEKTKVRNWLDRMYEDRLENKIAEDQYERRFNEYTDRLGRLEVTMAKHDRANINYYEFGVRILELSKNAKNLFEMANPEEKREFLGYLLSNSPLKDRKVDFQLKQPFSTIAKRPPEGERSAWGG